MNLTLLIPSLILTFLLSIIIIRLLGIWARKNGVGDVGGERHHHRGFIPVIGGIGFFFSLLLGWTFYIWASGLDSMLDYGVYGIFAGMLIIHLIGIADDIWGVSPAAKLLGSASAAMIYVSTNPIFTELNIPLIGTIELGIFAPIFSVIWIIGMINALNLTDGIDGLAGGVSIIILAGISYFAFIDGDYVVLTISLFLISSIMGFLVYNFPPASVFMGDGGSLLLGFTLGVLPQRVVAFDNGFVNFLILISLLMLPFFDTATAFFRRMLQGRNPLKPDKEHLHHRIISLGASSAQTMWILWTISALFVLISIRMHNSDDLEIVIWFFIQLTVLFAGLNRLGYLELRHKRFLPRWKFPGTKKYSKAPLIFKRFLHNLILLISDTFAVNIALISFLVIKFQAGPVNEIQSGFDVPHIGDLSSIVLTLFWIILFYLNDLYELTWDTPRVDRLVRFLKVSAFGGLVLSVLVFDVSIFQTHRLINLLIYLMILAGLVISFRFLIVSLERKFRILEYSDKNTLIIGNNEKTVEIIADNIKRDDLYFNIIGCIDKEYPEKCLGRINDLPKVIHENRIQEIIIAGAVQNQEEIFDIIAATENLGVRYKITKDLYEMISGLKKEDLFRYPLVNLQINDLLPWQKIIKRFVDLLLSTFAVIMGFIPAFLYSVYVKIRDGQVFFKEIVIGRYGKPFYLYKWHTEQISKSWIDHLFFRLMINKVTFFTSMFLGQMSMVGPQLQNWIEAKNRIRSKPYYRRRFILKPGLIGLSQMTSFYKKIKPGLEVEIELDSKYLDEMSLSLDFRIMINSLSLTLVRMFRGKT